MINLAVGEIYIKMTIDGESYDPFSAETLRVLSPTHPSYREEIMEASRRKYSIPKGDAAKLIAEEEATIIRSAEEKAIIEGRARRKARERGELIEEEEAPTPEGVGVPTSDNNQSVGKNKKGVKASQEAEPMI